MQPQSGFNLDQLIPRILQIEYNLATPINESPIKPKKISPKSGEKGKLSKKSSSPEETKTIQEIPEQQQQDKL